MKIRPGRTRSLIAGVMALVIMVVGLVMMSRTGGFGPAVPGMGGILSIFKILWIVIGLIGAGAAFYNAFSREGIALYEVEGEDAERGQNGQYCPQCGRPVSEDDSFCRHCGASLR
ncbi:MAG: zinc ribbon domain-containing protein [Anaerolineae bacterium]